MIIHPDITQASTLPGSFYSDPALFEQSAEKVFLPSWQFVTDQAVVKERGDVYPFTFMPGLLNEPLLALKDLEGDIRIMSNVCTHRGNLLVTAPGNLRELRCNYHGRRFGLDGCYRFMPETKGMQNFPSERDNLTQLKTERLGSMLFTAISPDIDFSQWVKPMPERLNWLPLNEFKHDPARSRTFEVNAHWALYMDNYLEGFHIPFVHGGLQKLIDYGSYQTTLFPHGNLQLAEAAENEICFDLPPSSPDFGKRIAAYYFWFFPNIMFNFYPWGLSLNIVQPVALQQTKVHFHAFIWKPELLNSGAGGSLDRVEQEDEAIVEQVQAGVSSRLYQSGRYSPRMEQGVHQFHGLLAKAFR